MIAEKDGSFTINCNKGEITMSTRNLGMTGKSYSSASEAFKDATYATAIQRPTESEYSGIWAFLGVLGFVAVFAYCFWLSINRF